MKVKYWRLLLSIWLLAVVPAEAQTPQLDTLYERALAGNRPALEKLVRLTHNRSRVRYYMGRHSRKSRLGKLAAYSLQDLVIFLPNELPTKSPDFSRSHLALVRRRMSELRYFPVYKHWGLSRLEHDSSSVYHLRKLPLGEPVTEAKQPASLLRGIPEGQRLDSLWQARSPLLLRELPRYTYWYRHRGYYSQNIAEFIERVTGMQVGVLNYTADTVYALSYDPYDVDLRNYTVFWARHYQQFRWSPQSGRFEAPGLVVNNRSYVQQLLDKLASPDSAIAFRAYTTFIEQNIQVPWRNTSALVGFTRNPALPVFWERFIYGQQHLRTYLQAHNVPLTLSSHLLQQSQQLVQPLAFGVRYQLENQLIEQLTPEQITAFELLMLDQERNEAAQESGGRVLDVWYSRHWAQITGSERLLSLYLKKCSVYHSLGIVGSSRNFIYKLNELRGKPRRLVRQLRATTPDADVRQVARQVLRPHWSYRARRTFSRVRLVSPPAKRYNADSLHQVLHHLGLEVYTAGHLNVARVDTALKYDAPLGFVGGHSPRTTTLQPLICLLEAHYQTDLGFGPTFGHWNMSGSPSVVHRARAWRWYLRRQGLVEKDADPISFVQKNSFRSHTGAYFLRYKFRRLRYWWRHL